MPIKIKQFINWQNPLDTEEKQEEETWSLESVHCQNKNINKGEKNNDETGTKRAIYIYII